ncbi:hypothetical protein [Lichenibacterium ramalinae]|uniref:Uncharacterized protein n=1 Tax=Lichenibacterium ramalinae TaxID=2316527 RepID=A0A4Q2RFW5_9HYPH|nr:hypothetical protein [Lichenibacterium ramalinae]RYB05289.1 hypothetical protein D3272_10085 [Lichenibacterium ramalinae]
MSSKSVIDPGSAITYALTSRLSPEGRVAISLQLFKGRGMAHSRSLGIVERHEVADVMSKCRRHLDRLGVERLSAPDVAPGRLPPAQTLKLKR